jgi:monoamine oxidase
MRVCVIGAGFAGLAAADALRRSNHEVIVLEARDRVGGRVWSQKLPNGSVVERGAEFIEHDQPEVAAAAERLGLRLAPTGMAYGDREPRGGRGVERGRLLAAYEALHAYAATLPPDPNRSIGVLLDGARLDPGAREAIQARIEISSTTPVEELSGATISKGGYRIDPAESYRVAGGNQGIALRFAELLGDALQLSTPANVVAWGDDGVRVLAGDMTIEADHAVIAVPAKLLGRIRFHPELPEWKTSANTKVDYGHAAKLFVPLGQPVPASAIMSVPERFWTWTAKGADRDVQRVVSCFAGTARALEALGVEQGPAGWLRKLAMLRPDLPLRQDGAVLSTWDDDPWIGAAYSVIRAGNPRDHDSLCASVGPLHFAGEHTAREWSSTMEGALRSGYRAAGEIEA